MKKLTRDQVIMMLRKEVPYLREKYGVEEIAIFGSFAKDFNTKNSDVDIIVGLKKPLGLDFIELACYLEDILGRKVDIATTDHLKNSFGNPRYKHIAENVEKSLIYV